MVKKVLISAIYFFSFIFFTPASYAAEEFATSYDVVYDIDNEGITTVTEKINLRNKTSEYYANQFKLIIGATEIFDIKASDGGGIMEVSSQLKDTSTEITVKFNSQVVGLDKVLPWTLQFKSRDFAQNLGKVWEVRAPKVSSESIDDYNLTIAVPVQFGEPTIITPTPKSQTTQQGKMFLTFGQDQLTESGVSASFGNLQIFDFDLTYHLRNTNLVPILTSIALPPDTAYQDVIYQRITPTPVNVTVDEDGNYLAWFRLNRSEKLDVKVTGSTKLYVKSKVKNPQLSEDLRKKYTRPDKYWESNHPQLLAKLSEILTPNSTKNSSERAKIIYRFVVDYLKYDSGRLNDNIERLGALTALSNPQGAVCMEFTDLFIALSRAAGIPARELDGFAYTANPALRPLSLEGDILHAWPEYFDDVNGWVMVDPTWENTTGGVDYFNKLDLNHFVFVIKGSSSESPIPAGSYKFAENNSRDVKVELSDNDFIGKPQLNVEVESANPILSGFPGKIKVRIANIGNAIYPSNNFSIAAGKLSILDGNSQNLGSIPPFGEASFDLNIRTNSLFDRFDDQIIVLVGSQKFSKDVIIKPFLIFQTYPLIAIGIVSLMGVIYLIILGTHLYRAKLIQKK